MRVAVTMSSPSTSDSLAATKLVSDAARIAENMIEYFKIVPLADTPVGKKKCSTLGELQ